MKADSRAILVAFEVHEEDYRLIIVSATSDTYAEYRKALDAVPKFFDIYDYAFGTLALSRMGYKLLTKSECKAFDKKSLAYAVRYFHDNGGDTMVAFQDEKGKWYDVNGHENGWQPFSNKVYDEIIAGTFVETDEEDWE